MNKKIFSPLKKREIKYSKILGFDIETAGTNNDFVLACFYSDDLQKTCYSIDEVKQFLNSRKIRGYKIYATNTAFDFLGCFYEEPNKWSIVERKGMIYSFKWYQQIVDNEKKNPITFLDTMKILPASVEKLGQILKIPKMKYPKCFGKQPQNNAERTELMFYCMNDAKISYKFVIDILIPFLDKYNLPIKSTIGSIAMYDFRRNYLKMAIAQEPQINRELAFKSYFGGRTETYIRGLFDEHNTQNGVTCLDINSLYPSVMHNFKYPNPNKSTYLEQGTMYNINKYAGVSEIEIEVPFMHKPPVPVKHDNKLIFPHGLIKGHYNHNEIKHFIKHGCTINKIFEQLIYPESLPLFKDFVKVHYAERLELKKQKNPIELMHKLLLNNLYGKFNFDYRTSSSMIPKTDLNFDMVKKAISIEEFGDFVNIKTKSENAPIYSFPILGSYVTSYARILMYDYLTHPQIQDKIIATDTDSIFIKDYHNEIECSDELGQMSVEDGYPVKKAIFVRPKMYMTHKPKCKGVKFKTYDWQEFIDLMQGTPITQERFIKYRTAVNSKEHHVNGVLKPNQIIQITKKIGLEDSKRDWNDTFNWQQEQFSKPLYYNYIEEQIKIANKEQEKHSLQYIDCIS